jgi:tetratricopeptide (TPR) repeat protein
VAGIGGLVGFAAYYQFRKEGLRFSGRTLLFEFGTSILRAFKTLLALFGHWLLQIKSFLIRFFIKFQPVAARFFKAFSEAAGQSRARLAQSGKVLALKTGTLFSKAKDWRPQFKIPVRISPKSKPHLELPKAESEPELGTEATLKPLGSIIQEKQEALMIQAETEKQSRQILKHKEAVLLRAVADNPRDISLYKRLGFLYLELDESSEARHCFEQALKLGSQDEQVKQSLEKLESRKISEPV